MVTGRVGKLTVLGERFFGHCWVVCRQQKLPWECGFVWLPGLPPHPQIFTRDDLEVWKSGEGFETQGWKEGWKDGKVEN